MATATFFPCVWKTQVLISHNVLRANCSLNLPVLVHLLLLPAWGHDGSGLGTQWKPLGNTTTAARGHNDSSSPGQGFKASVHTPTAAELGRKWLEALSLGVNCLLSKSLFFMEKGGSVPKNSLARLKWAAARLLAAWVFFRQEGFKHCCSESGRTLFGQH